MNNWSNKNVLVTGVTGFVGGNLVKKLVDQRANVFGIVRNNNFKSFLFIEKYDLKIRIFKGDLMNHIELFNIIT